MHPEGMPETRIWHPYQGANPIFCNVPVVALRLPPANFSNRFAVKHTNLNYVHNITNLPIDSTRALHLSLNPKMWPLAEAAAAAAAVVRV